MFTLVNTICAKLLTVFNNYAPFVGIVISRIPQSDTTSVISGFFVGGYLSASSANNARNLPSHTPLNLFQRLSETRLLSLSSGRGGCQALCNNPEIGALRETFFVSQLSHGHELRYPNKADFLVNGETLFEVGAERKTARQIQDTSQPAYLAIDNIEHGRGQRILLWLFGFVY